MTINKQQRRHILGLIFLSLLIFVIVKSDRLFLELENLLQLTESAIQHYPRIGMLLFVVLSMLSAMLAFFSSAILVPVGVHTWGMATCFLLLWIGWFLGGLAAYAIGYFAGGSIVALLVGEKRLQGLKDQLRPRAHFLHILLFQVALPSEVPGYILGTVRIRLHYYLGALALTELPYALGTVYLGESFLQRDMTLFVLIMSIGVIFALTAYQMYRRQLTLDNYNN